MSCNGPKCHIQYSLQVFLDQNKISFTNERFNIYMPLYKMNDAHASSPCILIRAGLFTTLKKISNILLHATKNLHLPVDTTV